MDRAVVDYVSGMSTLAVGKKYGIDPQTVASNVRARGGEVRSRSGAVISGDKLAEAVRLRRAGWNYSEIGRHFGVSRVAATNALKQAGQD